MNIQKALNYCRPDAEWILSGITCDGLEWLDKNQEKPTQVELEQAWAEVQAEDRRREIEQKRKARYEKETDPILYDALALLVERDPEIVKMCPELKAWSKARDKIKKELPYKEVLNEPNR